MLHVTRMKPTEHTDAGRTSRAGDGPSTAAVISAASAGTVLEWYDFFLYAAVATIISHHFFSAVNETTGYIFALLAFAAGFAVRPLGAFIFGAAGDLWGRRNTFLITLLLMGVATLSVALIPTFAEIGVWAPVALIAARLVQGLALGGEYGGAAVYVAEHSPTGKRGFHTSFIQVTATIGLALSLIVVLATRLSLGEEVFADWGWRVPFALSALLLLVSLWIRLSLAESPVFSELVAEGGRSTRPLSDAFGTSRNRRLMLLALFGLSAGMTVVWYTSQFYVLFFLDRILKVDSVLANGLVAAALLLGSPFFIFFGWLSDKIGRKPVILTGCLLAAMTFIPIFQQITAAANPALFAASQSAPVTILADRDTCSLQFDPVGKSSFKSSCDIAVTQLASAGVPYRLSSAAAGAIAIVQVGTNNVASFNGEGLDPTAFTAAKTQFSDALRTALTAAGYPSKADSAKVDIVTLLGLLTILVVYATMCYGPLAAALAELFPTKVRYTSVSIPYNLATGWIGGFLPAAAFAMVAATGDIYFGLWYPISFALLTVVVGALFVPETRRASLD